MYKDTLFLPKTLFSMKANLNDLSPKIIKSWKNIKKNPGNKKFLLHSGPPFANGNSHLGHALNFILKDAICRYKLMTDHDVSFYWGWDCHGLPIEIKVEQEYKKNQKDLSDIISFRKSCRDYAAHWTQVQKEDLMKLGIMVNKDEAYSTMDYKSEASILNTFFEFVKKNMVYRDVKPVFWSIAEKTAFAEAEIQYVEDHVSTSCYVMFPVINSLEKFNTDNLHVVIWTTTPWTLPCNRAIAYNNLVEYAVVYSKNLEKKIVIAKNLIKRLEELLNINDLEVIEVIDNLNLDGLKCSHPLANLHESYDFDVPLVYGDHVTEEVGTGFVHMAPSHGIEDFIVCKKNKINAFDSVTEDGLFSDCIGLFAGKKIFESISEILLKIKECNLLLGSTKITHSYPYSWRSKTPLIFRTTPQWFIRFDENFRNVCIDGINQVNWIPVQGKNRITSMIENRPDWCISRQRLWGIPLFLFVNKKDHHPLIDEELMNVIVSYVEKNGLDICFTDDVWSLLPDQYNKDDFYIVKDVIDVWFESGATHKFVIHDILGEKQADFYLEGSDQHRGWFQSSLMESCGLHGFPPFKNVLTHGFLVDQHGKKVSKSEGNAKSLDELLTSNGADILRLWALSCDFTNDMRIGDEIITRVKDVYRRIRNIMRYLIGSTYSLKEEELIDYENLMNIEKYVLHRLNYTNSEIIDYFDSCNFKEAINSIHNFCIYISADYLDLRKDCLYCDSVDFIHRRSLRSVLKIITSYLIRWIAPVLSVTSDEAWKYFNAGLIGDDSDLIYENYSSIHVENLFEFQSNWANEDIKKNFDQIFDFKKVVNIEIEKARNSGIISGNLGCLLKLQLNSNLYKILTSDIGIAIEDLFGVSQVEISISDEDVINVSVADGEKCDRCWKIVQKHYLDGEYKLCDRCNKFREMS